MAEKLDTREQSTKEDHMKYVQRWGHSLYVISGSQSLVSIEYFDWRLDEFLPLCDLNIDKSKIMYVVCTQSSITLFCEDSIQELHFETLQLTKNRRNYKVPKKAGVVIHENEILFFGGTGNTSNKICSFDSRDGLRVKPGLMQEIRELPSIASLREYVYVTGGIYNNVLLNSAEMYNLSTGFSCRITGMLKSRVSHGCTALNGKIYVCGNVEFATNEVEKAEVYDPQSLQWKFVTELKTDHHLFSFAGENDLNFIEGVCLGEEEYRIQTYKPTENSVCLKYPHVKLKQKDYSLISTLVTNSATHAAETWLKLNNEFENQSRRNGAIPCYLSGEETDSESSE